MSGAEAALERLATKAERIALARAESLVRDRHSRSAPLEPRSLRPLTADHN
ncbi:hypothetical protein [Croceibacterium mercuriale]|uniref:hypothetical protein n=1 Tax=Croceibacterium mercuriale TaxID=1572751 RepID=UPI000AC86BF2|nr:hypothetical protein [Croceibacterium mercuriale]